jgi:hypothetical protein
MYVLLDLSLMAVTVRVLIFWEALYNSSSQMFQKTALSPSSGLKNKPHKQPANRMLCFLLPCLTLKAWRWQQYIPPNHLWSFARLHSVTPQKTVSSYTCNVYAGLWLGPERLFTKSGLHCLSHRGSWKRRTLKSRNCKRDYPILQLKHPTFRSTPSGVVWHFLRRWGHTITSLCRIACLLQERGVTLQWCVYIRLCSMVTITASSNNAIFDLVRIVQWYQFTFNANQNSVNARLAQVQLRLPLGF